MFGHKNQNENTHVEANIVDGSLVVACMNADTPKVWRTTQFAQASFEVLTQGDKYVLAMTVDHTVEDIAEFSDKADAVYALRVVMAAMTGGAVVSMPQKAKSTLAADRKEVEKKRDTPKHGFFFYLKAFLKFVCWIVLSVAVFVVLVAIFLPAPEGSPEQTTQVIEKGTPVPAEQLFAE